MMNQLYQHMHMTTISITGDPSMQDEVMHDRCRLCSESRLSHPGLPLKG